MDRKPEPAKKVGALVGRWESRAADAVHAPGVVPRLVSLADLPDANDETPVGGTAQGEQRQQNNNPESPPTLAAVAAAAGGLTQLPESSPPTSRLPLGEKGGLDESKEKADEAETSKNPPLRVSSFSVASRVATWGASKKAEQSEESGGSDQGTKAADDSDLRISTSHHHSRHRHRSSHRRGLHRSHSDGVAPVGPPRHPREKTDGNYSTDDGGPNYSTADEEFPPDPLPPRLDRPRSEGVSSAPPKRSDERTDEDSAPSSSSGSHKRHHSHRHHRPRLNRATSEGVGGQRFGAGEEAQSTDDDEAAILGEDRRDRFRRHKSVTSFDDRGVHDKKKDRSHSSSHHSSSHHGSRSRSKQSSDIESSPRKKDNRHSHSRSRSDDEDYKKTKEKEESNDEFRKWRKALKNLRSQSSKPLDLSHSSSHGETKTEPQKSPARSLTRSKSTGTSYPAAPSAASLSPPRDFKRQASDVGRSRSKSPKPIYNPFVEPRDIPQHQPHQNFFNPFVDHTVPTDNQQSLHSSDGISVSSAESARPMEFDDPTSASEDDRDQSRGRAAQLADQINRHREKLAGRLSVYREKIASKREPEPPKSPEKPRQHVGSPEPSSPGLGFPTSLPLIQGFEQDKKPPVGAQWPAPRFARGGHASAADRQAHINLYHQHESSLQEGLASPSSTLPQRGLVRNPSESMLQSVAHLVNFKPVPENQQYSSSSEVFMDEIPIDESQSFRSQSFRTLRMVRTMSSNVSSNLNIQLKHAPRRALLAMMIGILLISVAGVSVYYGLPGGSSSPSGGSSSREPSSPTIFGAPGSPNASSPHIAYYVVHWGYDSTTECGSLQWSNLTLYCDSNTATIGTLMLQNKNAVGCKETGNMAECGPTSPVSVAYDTEIIVTCTGIPEEEDLSLYAQIPAARGSKCPYNFRERTRKLAPKITVPDKVFQFLSVSKFCYGGDEGGTLSAPTLTADFGCNQGALRNAEDFGGPRKQHFCIGSDVCPLGECEKPVHSTAILADVGQCFVGETIIESLGNPPSSFLRKIQSSLIRTPVVHAPNSLALVQAPLDLPTFHVMDVSALYAVVVGIDTQGCIFYEQVLEFSCENPNAFLSLIAPVDLNIDCVRLESNKIECKTSTAVETKFATTFMLGCAGQHGSEGTLGLRAMAREISYSECGVGDFIAISQHWFSSGLFCFPTGGPLNLDQSQSCEVGKTEVWPLPERPEQTYCVQREKCSVVPCEMELQNVQVSLEDECFVFKNAGEEEFDFNVDAMKSQVSTRLAHAPYLEREDSEGKPIVTPDTLQREAFFVVEWGYQDPNANGCGSSGTKWGELELICGEPRSTLQLHHNSNGGFNCVGNGNSLKCEVDSTVSRNFTSSVLIVSCEGEEQHDLSLSIHMLQGVEQGQCEKVGDSFQWFSAGHFCYLDDPDPELNLAWGCDVGSEFFIQPQNQQVCIGRQVCNPPPCPSVTSDARAVIQADSSCDILSDAEPAPPSDPNFLLTVARADMIDETEIPRRISRAQT